MAVDDCVEIRFDSLFDPWLRIAFLPRAGLVWFGLAMSGQDSRFGCFFRFWGSRDGAVQRGEQAMGLWRFRSCFALWFDIMAREVGIAWE